MAIDAIRIFHKNLYFAVAKNGNSLIVPNDNLGLTFDRFVPQIECPGRGIKTDNLDVLSSYRMANHPGLCKSYQYAFDKWTAAVKGVEKENKAISFDITSLTKVIFGFGNDSALEVGVHLNKPWGVPYISGSAIKGVVASYLRKTKTLEVNSPDYVNIFGGTYGDKDYSGTVVFNDAWLYPDCDSWFERDIINPHYQQYYSGNRLPDGMDDPVPVQTLALRPGLSFFVSMQGPENLLKYLKNVLKEALCKGGVGAGAKTAVGYGRFELVESEKNTIGVPSVQNFGEVVVAAIVGKSKKDKWQVRVVVRGVDKTLAINNSAEVPSDAGVGTKVRVKVDAALATYLP